jgi:hypothetical protein
MLPIDGEAPVIDLELVWRTGALSPSAGLVIEIARRLFTGSP